MLLLLLLGLYTRFYLLGSHGVVCNDFIFLQVWRGVWGGGGAGEAGTSHMGIGGPTWGMLPKLIGGFDGQRFSGFAVVLCAGYVSRLISEGRLFKLLGS